MFREYVKKFTKWIGVPVILISVALTVSIIFFFNSDINPNILSVNHFTNNIKNNNGGVSGTFTAQDNYLGIITVRFDKKEQLSGNSMFRIKNALDEDWYHEATVAAEQYYTIPQYSFGLPVIARSKNKTYQFEIQLLDNTTSSSGLSLSNKYPVLISHYAFPKNIFVENKMLLAQFIFKKISYYINQEFAWKVLAVYSIPLILYLLCLVFEHKLQSFEFIIEAKEKLSAILKPYILILFLSIFIDIFVIRKYSDSTTTLFTFLWILGVAAYRLESRYSYGVALIFLTFCPFLLSANMDWVAEKSAVWAYIFLVVGTVHGIIEMKAEQSPKLTHFLNFISRIFSFICHIDSFLLARAGEVKQFAIFSVRNFAKVITVFIIIITLLFFGFDAYLKYMSYLDRQLKNPGKPFIEPTLAYPGTKVFLYGDRFGDGTSAKYALMKDGKKVRVDYWEDHKIIFTVPLSWKPGPMNLWIEKPVEWNAETVIEKTKPITIKLLKVTGSFTPDDDLYFEEMKDWKKETKELNGYE